MTPPRLPGYVWLPVSRIPARFVNVFADTDGALLTATPEMDVWLWLVVWALVGVALVDRGRGNVRYGENRFGEVNLKG